MNKRQKKKFKKKGCKKSYRKRMICFVPYDNGNKCLISYILKGRYIGSDYVDLIAYIKTDGKSFKPVYYKYISTKLVKSCITRYIWLNYTDSEIATIYYKERLF